MEKTEGSMNEAKVVFEKLKTDVISVLLTKEKINNNIFKRLKKSLYDEDKKLANFILTLENVDDLNRIESKTLPIRLDYVKKQEIDRSTLYSIDGSFQLLHVDIADLRFLGKSATHPKYCLVTVDIYSSK